MPLNIALSIMMLFSNVWGILAVVDYKNGTPWPGNTWKIELKNRAAIPLYATHKVLILLDANSCMHALNPDNGKVVWQRCTDIAGLSYVSRVGTDVVLRDSASENLVGVDESTGAERWRQKLPAAGFGFYTTNDGSLYYHESVLHSYDLIRKEENWQSSSGGGMREVIATNDGWLYFLKDNHTIVAAMKKDGRRVWWHALGDDVIWPGAVCGNTLVLMANSKDLVAYNRITGEQAWLRRVNDGNGSEKDKETVLVGTDNGVYVLRSFDNIKKYSCNNGDKEWESTDRWSVVGMCGIAEIIDGKYLLHMTRYGSIHLIDIINNVKMCAYNIGGGMLGIAHDRKRIYVSSADIVGRYTIVQAIDIEQCIKNDPCAGMPVGK